MYKYIPLIIGKKRIEGERSDSALRSGMLSLKGDSQWHITTIIDQWEDECMRSLEWLT